MIFRNADERAAKRQELRAGGKKTHTICDSCLHGRHSECSMSECCCICNELIIPDRKAPGTVAKTLRKYAAR